MSKLNVSEQESIAGVQAWCTYGPVYHAGNVDSEPGWIEEEFKARDAKFDYFRSVRENDYNPHYIHNVQAGPDLRARAITAGPMMSNCANGGTQLKPRKQEAAVNRPPAFPETSQEGT